MMNFVLKTRNCVLKTRNCVLKIGNCALKTMNFAGQRRQRARPSPAGHLPGGHARVRISIEMAAVLVLFQLKKRPFQSKFAVTLPANKLPHQFAGLSMRLGLLF